MAQVSTTTATILGGFTIPFDLLRELLPDDRWAIYAAGMVTAPGPQVKLTVSYQLDGGSLVDVGSTTVTQTNGKAEIGPYPVRGPFAIPLGVPAGETIIAIVLQGQLVSAGTAADLRRWTMWLRMTPRRV